MIVQQKRAAIRSRKPLRYSVDNYWTPIHFFKLYFACIAFFGIFEYLFVSTYGWAFLGIYGRPFTLGMYLFVGGIAVYLVAYRRRMMSRDNALGRFLLGFLLLEFIILVIMGVQNGMANGNEQLATYQKGLWIVLLVTTFAYWGVESQREMRDVIHHFSLFLVGLSLADTLSILLHITPGMPKLPFNLFLFMHILPLGGLYFFVDYLLSRRNVFWKGFLFIVASSSIVLRFQKPVIVPYIIVIGMVFLIVFAVAGRPGFISRTKVVKRSVVLLLLAFLLPILMAAITPGSLLVEYRILFFKIFLKRNPVTGVLIGRIDGGRFYLIAQGWEMVKQSPIWGFGLGPGISSGLGTIVFPHNLMIDFLIGMGLLGIVLLVLFLFIIIRYIVTRMDWYRYPVMKIGIVGYLIYAFVFSQVGVFWGQLGLIHLSALLLGITLKLATLDGARQLEPRVIAHHEMSEL